jgi:ABC-type uncharacterized transport system substrate-binding protein
VVVAFAIETEAQGAELLVLSQPAVGQYTQVATAVREQHPSATLVDVADAAAVKAALGRSPAVVVAVGSKAFEIAKAQVKTGVVIAAAVLAPATSGMENVVAIPLEPSADQTVELLVQLGRGSGRVLALYSPSNEPALEDARMAVRRKGLSVDFQPVGDMDAFHRFFRSVVQGYTAVWLLADARLANPELVRFMVATALENKIALVGFMEGMTKAGAYGAISADFAGIGKEVGKVAAELMGKGRDGAKTAFRYVPGKLTVNDKTRQLLGIK